MYFVVSENLVHGIWASIHVVCESCFLPVAAWRLHPTVGCFIYTHPVDVTSCRLTLKWRLSGLRCVVELPVCLCHLWYINFCFMFIFMINILCSFQVCTSLHICINSDLFFPRRCHVMRKLFFFGFFFWELCLTQATSMIASLHKQFNTIMWQKRCAVRTLLLMWELSSQRRSFPPFFPSFLPG